MKDTIQQLKEHAETERCAGHRDKFLELQKQIEIEEQKKVLDAHTKQYESIAKEFSVGTYIPELRATIKEIKHGCGTVRGWINIYLSSKEKPYEYWELKKAIREARDAQEASAYFSSLKFSDKKNSLCIGDSAIDTLEKLIKVMDLDLPTQEELDDWNINYYCEIMDDVRKHAIGDGYTDDEAEEMALKAEEDEMDRVYNQHKNAIEHTLNYLLNFHHLEVVEIGEKYYLNLLPGFSWKQACSQTAITISGYGMFQYNSADELKDGGPYKTYCEAVIEHIHWMKHYPEVYGVSGYRRMYESRY